MSNSPFIGYPGRIWGACYQALTWLQSMLTPAASATVLETPAMMVFETLWNGLKALSLWQISNALAVEAQNLILVESLPLGLDPASAPFLSSRAAACTSVATGL